MVRREGGGRGVRRWKIRVLDEEWEVCGRGRKGGTGVGMCGWRGEGGWRGSDVKQESCAVIRK